MEYEYVALTWRALDAEMDRFFQDDKCSYLGAGWKEYVRAPFPPRHFGGACIMRRPKQEPQDEPRKWTKSELQSLIRETTILAR